MQKLWLLACAASAVIVATIVGLLFVQQQRAPAAVASNVGAPRDGCELAPLSFASASTDEAPPVLLWAVAPARLMLDGVPVFSPPEKPKRFSPGEHLLRIEAEGHEPMEATVRFDAFTPALLHASVDPHAGISLVRLGAACTSCRPALAEETLTFERAPVSAQPRLLFGQAAAALRQHRRGEAAQALRHVAPKDRKSPLFARLAGQVLLDTFQSTAARALLSAVSVKEDGSLGGLVTALDALSSKEVARRNGLRLQRWNRLTERFNAVIERYGSTFPGPTDAASRRLGALSVVFEEGARAEDASAQHEALAAAETSFLQLVDQLKSTRPDDCAFQNELVSTASP